MIIKKYVLKLCITMDDLGAALCTKDVWQFVSQFQSSNSVRLRVCRVNTLPELEPHSCDVFG